MADITATVATADGSAVAITSTTLTASDTLTYKGQTGKQLLILTNGTGSSVDVTLLGDAVSAFTVVGYGEVDPTAGKVVTVADGTTVVVVLAGLDKYLTDADKIISVTGGTDVVAQLINLS